MLLLRARKRRVNHQRESAVRRLRIDTLVRLEWANEQQKVGEPWLLAGWWGFKRGEISVHHNTQFFLLLFPLAQHASPLAPHGPLSSPSYAWSRLFFSYFPSKRREFGLSKRNEYEEVADYNMYCIVCACAPRRPLIISTCTGRSDAYRDILKTARTCFIVTTYLPLDLPFH